MGRRLKMKIVGISACPAGLAHTPMAAKALEKAGIGLGYDIKMEQQGSMGQINVITNEEAREADLVIIASDQKIAGMERFAGKKVIRVDINICIKAPEAVIKKCVDAVSK
jgi:PTS system fructose-specific IIB component